MSIKPPLHGPCQTAHWSTEDCPVLGSVKKQHERRVYRSLVADVPPVPPKPVPMMAVLPCQECPKKDAQIATLTAQLEEVRTKQAREKAAVAERVRLSRERKAKRK